MQELHVVMGHLASPSILKSLKLRFWWPNMDNDFRNFIRSCPTCQLASSTDRPPVNPLHPLPPPGIPFHTWSIDFQQDLPLTNNGNSQIIDAICSATKLYVSKAVPDRSAKTVSLFLFELMTKFGAPHAIITDRGSSFMAEVLQDYLRLQQTHHYPSTPYHPQTNGAVERAHRVLQGILEPMTLGCRDKWDEFLPVATFVMNSRTHTVTGFSPFQLVYGFSPRMPGDLSPRYIFDPSDSQDRASYTERELTRLGINRVLALERLQKQSTSMIKRHEAAKRVAPATYKVGDLVKVKRNPMAKIRAKWDARWTGPWRIARLGQHDSYFLTTVEGQPAPNPVNHALLAPWISRESSLSDLAPVDAGH
jgi:hypothetical protein